MVLGRLCIKQFLETTGGNVGGRVVSDAKDRFYSAQYVWDSVISNPPYIEIRRRDRKSKPIMLPASLDLDESLVAFFGLYSGDGAKGSERSNEPGRVHPTISFSQTQPQLIKFAIKQFRRIFGDLITFTFSLGEDSTYFLTGTGAQLLQDYYGGATPPTPALSIVLPEPSQKDIEYCAEQRPRQGSAEDDLAFYYFHKSAMEEILSAIKESELIAAGIELLPTDRITTSMRRPYKKGARLPGGTSRADELVVGGVSGFGELFLKMMHEVESSIEADQQTSSQGLVEWLDTPSAVGLTVNLQDFFQSHPYGLIGGRRPQLRRLSATTLVGRWPHSIDSELRSELLLTPLWCYVSGLYLAEGTTAKSLLFSMFRINPQGLALSFTSSEGTSIELFLRALSSLFGRITLNWKLKVGTQYFTELVVIGLKNAVPMLRGGSSGDGKLRTMEISLAVKNWALEVAPILTRFEDRYTHTEPTGAGVPRIDVSLSSSLCKWYFPLLMYAAFGSTADAPATDFA